MSPDVSPENHDRLARIRAAAPFDLGDVGWARLARAYATPPRAYHDLTHVEEVAGHYADVASGPGWRQPGEVFAALLYHDAIYLAGRPDNELASSRLARAELTAHGLDRRLDLARVEALIVATAGHGKLMADQVDADLALCLDCDTAILGAEPARFDAYDEAIAREYAAVTTAEAYRAGRLAFLERLLARPHVFLSNHFRAALEQRARANLRRALADPR